MALRAIARVARSARQKAAAANNLAKARRARKRAAYKAKTPAGKARFVATGAAKTAAVVGGTGYAASRYVDKKVADKRRKGQIERTRRKVNY